MINNLKQKNNWQTNNFEDCIDKVVYPKKILKKDFLESGDFPAVSQESNFINGYWNNKKNLFKLEKPVVIFGDHTKILKFIDFDFVLGADGVKILQSKDFLYPKYFYYFLQNLDLKSLGYARHYRLLKEKDISYPPLPEQKRIVKILDEAFEKIEKAKENTEKNLKNSKELFESYLQNVFENKGKDWEEKNLGEVYDVRDGTHDSPKYQKEGYLLITSKNLRNGFNTMNAKFISEKDYRNINKRSSVDKGDILFAMIGTIGTPTVIEKEPNFAIKNVALFKVPKNQNNYFLKYYLDSSFVKNKMQQEAKGTTQKFVGLGYLRNFKIFIPKSLTTQKQIVAKLDKLSSHTKKMENHHKFILNSLEELKKSLLKKAFNGEL